MKRPLVFVLPLTVVLLFGFLLSWLEAQQPPIWCMTLDRYLQSTRPEATVHAVARATMPWQLTPSLHGRVVDCGNYG
jgi:hypothetical protein